ncbi:hypothetical protein GC176_10290 [bacterium]|nr:hypothetical protein [bacterium]
MALLVALISGCGTTRWTDTPRAATEELLLTDAIDRAVDQIDASPLCGRRIFLDTQYVGTKSEAGYLTSSLRQHLAAAGCKLASSQDAAELVVEARVGSLSTNRHDSLIGVPATAVPPVLTGVPVAIPEVALSKKTTQTGISKLALFAWWIQDGTIAWQSGVSREDSVIQNRWMLGLGPYASGASTVRESDAGATPDVPLLADLARAGGKPLPEPPPSTLTLPAVYDVTRPFTPPPVHLPMPDTPPAGTDASPGSSPPGGAANLPAGSSRSLRVGHLTFVPTN